MSVSVSPLRLHLGCGPQKLEGWINVDSVPEFRPDLVHDITRPLPYEDGSVDEILAQDLLEHFDKYMRFIVFYEWTRVLKTGGTITVQVPDFQKLLLRYFKFGFDRFVDVLFGETMFRSETYIGHYGSHKWGYSAKTLQEFVRRFGIEPTEVRRKSLNITLKGTKVRHVSPEELDETRIYAHANAAGTGQPDLPLRFVKERIKIFEENDGKIGHHSQI